MTTKGLAVEKQTGLDDNLLHSVNVSDSPVALAQGITLAGILRRSFRLYGHRLAVVDEHTRLTYRELDERSNRLANALIDTGLKRGDRIGVLSETRPEYVEIYAAAAKVGLTVIALNIRLHPDELAYCVETARPLLLMTSGAHVPQIDAFRNRVSSVHTWISLDTADGAFLDYEEFLLGGEETDPYSEVAPNDIHNVLYTSGTTGRPKGAMITHRAAAIRGLRLAQWFGLDERDGFVGWLPLFHCGGDESLYATLLTGGVFAAVHKADVKLMYRLIEREKLTWTLLLPGVITDFLHDSHRRDHDLSSFRFAIGYANMMPQVVKELTRELNIRFWDAYGQTETSYLLAHGEVLPGAEPSLHKSPAPLLDVMIVDNDMIEVPVGIPGECVVRGPSVMSGYLDDPAATAEAFRGGWLHTGDILVRNEDGTLTFADRKKYLIKTGGENVYPAEVEHVIAQHEAVQEVCVLGVPDEHWGEAVKAVVVLRPGQCVSGEEIVAWCRQRLASYKRPRYVQFLGPQDIPRSTTGKVLRHELARLPVSAEQKV